MEQVQLVDNILPDNTNRRILELLLESPWNWTWDNDRNRASLLENIVNNKNYGFKYISLENETPTYHNNVNTELNTYARLIVDTVLDRLNFDKDIFTYRFLWNMYFPNAVADSHQDGDDTHFTILYAIHPNDGGTIIKDEFFPDVQGQAKVFESGWWHQGKPPTNTAVRFNLNIVLRRNCKFKFKII